LSASSGTRCYPGLSARHLPTNANHDERIEEKEMNFIRIAWIVGGILFIGALGYLSGNWISSGSGGIVGTIIGAIAGALLGYVVGRWGEGADAAKQH
jgi:hypothetical protein